MIERDVENCLLIIFDFDGVLANSQIAYACQMQETVEHFTKQKIPINVFLKRGGNTDQAQDFMEFLGTDDFEEIDKAIIHYVSLTEKYAYLRDLYPNVRTTLEELRKNHFIGLVSRKTHERMLKWLHHFKLTHLFDKPIGTLENSKANAIDDIRAEFQIPTERTLMVGDTEFDITSAMDAEVSSVLALYGAEKPEAALALGPTYVINSIEEILEISKKHLNS
ncbi:HAD family hydrolase [Candidatus Heimdallarchaeota archaeon]|nr:MAG: HAD family hydrolase [Candidatus Heimdallarchaeota archaeon]